MGEQAILPISLICSLATKELRGKVKVNHLRKCTSDSARCGKLDLELLPKELRSKVESSVPCPFTSTTV